MSAETTGNRPKGCLPGIFHDIARWWTESPPQSPPPLETTSWRFRPAEKVDLGEVGTIKIPAAYEKRHLGGTITVDAQGIGWSGGDIDVDPDGTIIRSERDWDLEAEPDAETKELLRNLLERTN